MLWKRAAIPSQLLTDRCYWTTLIAHNISADNSLFPEANCCMVNDPVGIIFPDEAVLVDGEVDWDSVSLSIK